MTQQGINNASMLKVGTILRGTYRIDSYLSSGGFGNTYIATNIEFEERVAIKEFFMKGVTQRDDNQTTVSVSNLENTNSFQEQKEKFKKEARRIRQLKNEHIVSVHDLFEENGTAYYVMPLGKLFSTEKFEDLNFEQITPDLPSDVMDQLHKGYTERRREINEGFIETADNEPIGNLIYAGTPGVFPLDSEGSKPAKKTENKYSDYKCFTI